MKSVFGRPKRVAVLGCGPAGMFATHAFAQAGWDVVVYSKRRRSDMFGAQYLHEPIPGLAEVKQRITYELIGTPEQYRTKVYGPSPSVNSVSPEMLLGEHDAWDIRAAYFEAYERYEPNVIDTPDIDGTWYVNQFLNKDSRKHWRLVVSTIPASALCVVQDKHQFLSQPVWAAGDAPELGRMSPISCAAGKVICNGETDRAWYRVSNVFGHTTAEWPYDRRPPISGISQVLKPIRTTCDCFSKVRGQLPLYRTGRFGRWEKGVLSHHSYELAAALAADYG